VEEEEEEEKKEEERWERSRVSVYRLRREKEKGEGTVRERRLERPTSRLVDALRDPLNVVLVQAGHRDAPVAGHVDVAVVDHCFALSGCLR
jgi:hypothetical protein